MNNPITLASKLLLLVALLALLTLSAPMTAQTHAAMTRVHVDWGKLPLYFIANQGQLDARVAFYVQGSDKTLYFASEGVTFALTDGRRTTKDERRMTKDEGRRTNDSAAIQRWVVKLDFVGANAVQPIGQAQTDAIISYFKGSRDEWRTGLPTYSQIVYRDLWAGIDLLYSGTINRLKYEFVVAPGADPARIRLAYRGASVRVNDAGQLEVSTPAGGFHDDAPIAYQEVNGARVPVAVAYALDDDGTYGFRLGAYDATLPLVVDPAVLLYATYFGGSGEDVGYSIAVDAAGNAYITGYTYSSEVSFPETVGPDLTYNGYGDAFVAKLNASGTALIYAGYIGGNDEDIGRGIAVDTAGNAYITGSTISTQATFPKTVGPDLTHNGYSDAFVAKVNASGTALIYAGFIGGSNGDEGYGIAVDAAGNAYVTGATKSTQTTFPDGDGFGTLIGPDTTYNGGLFDVFVAKVRADGTGLVYAGYIGGYDEEMGFGIAVDTAGAAYVTGYTWSPDSSFPVKVGPDLTSNGFEGDAFVAKVKADGTGLDYCGFIGLNGAANKHAQGQAIAVDTAGNAYVTGYTNHTQTTFPVTVGPDLTHNGGDDVFVAKVRADGTGFVYVGYIGGSGDDYGWGIAVDAAGNAYVIGSTDSTESTFPVIGGPDLTFNGGWDVFVARVKADGTGLDYCGYIGGSGGDTGYGIAVDSTGNAYAIGYTKSTQTTFPDGDGFGAIPGVDQSYNGGVSDAFVAKISPPTSPVFKLYLPLILR